MILTLLSNAKNILNSKKNFNKLIRLMVMILTGPSTVILPKFNKPIILKSGKETNFILISMAFEWVI